MPNSEHIDVHPYHSETGRFEEIAQVYLGGYEWGIAVVFRDKATGRLYGDTDAGCSCYGPFDEHVFGGLGDLTEITHEREAAALLDNIRGEGDELEQPSTEQRRDFCNAVRQALK